MLVHEDKILEDAAMGGELCIAVPVSVYIPLPNGEWEITAYENVWEICMEHEAKYGEDILSDSSVKELFSKISPVADKMGYTADEKESRVIREYRVSSLNEDILNYSDMAQIVRDESEIRGLECPLLHPPCPDPEDECDVCAVVVRDGVIVSCAGVNDISDDDAVEIFVETAKAYRGKGYGKAAVATLVRHLTNSGYAVAYNCADTNKSSSAIAEKLNMTLAGKRLSIVCFAK
ncbi:MAG: GNAT family N-acetyltransferase [Ruminococcaceae bacterium]|nr:GNAT family N-acetyltransferase [Oscillospiraceae bacterium]